MATNQNLNSERVSLLGNSRGAHGIASKVDIHHKPQIVCLIVVFVCGILSISFGGIGHTIKVAESYMAVKIELNIWTGAMVSCNYLIYDSVPLLHIYIFNFLSSEVSKICDDTFSCVLLIDEADHISEIN